MIAGRLTEYVTLQYPVVDKDAYGSKVTTYVTCRRVHAEVQWKQGGTSQEVSELFPGVRLNVIVYSAHPVEEKWRVEYDGVPYIVTAVERSRTRGFKRLICEKVNE